MEKEDEELALRGGGGRPPPPWSNRRPAPAICLQKPPAPWLLHCPPWVGGGGASC